jgi:hypothetical protein
MQVAIIMKKRARNYVIINQYTGQLNESVKYTTREIKFKFNKLTGYTGLTVWRDPWTLKMTEEVKYGCVNKFFGRNQAMYFARSHTHKRKYSADFDTV